MPAGSLVTVLGTVAALLTTLAFVPQIQKIWKTGGRDVSYPMLMLYLVGVTLWLAYGLLIGAKAVIAANAASIVFVGICIALKVIKEREHLGRAGGDKRVRIAIDMDDTIAASFRELLRRYNAEFGEEVTAAQLVGTRLEKLLPAERHGAIRRMVHDATFFENLEVLPDAVEVIRELMDRYEVFIVSAAFEVPVSFAAKHRWLQKHFPFIPETHMVFCGDKTIIRADYLIDDTPRHFTRFAGTPILFSAPHNAEETRFRRVASWQEIREMFLGGQDRATPVTAGNVELATTGE